MNREAFLAVAHLYYATAILYFLEENLKSSNDRVYEESDIREYYVFARDGRGHQGYLSRSDLFEKAIEWLSHNGVIEHIKDDFGPNTVILSQSHEVSLSFIADGTNSILDKFEKLGRSKSWLVTALKNIEKKYVELDIDKDFPERSDESWAPLPLDRDDSSIKTATERVGEVIEMVRADNGYVVNHPEERTHILTLLRAAWDRLRADTSISVGYLRHYAIDPLKQLVIRFGPGSIGASAKFARGLLIEWLKKKGINGLDDLLG